MISGSAQERDASLAFYDRLSATDVGALMMQRTPGSNPRRNNCNANDV
jgi:hypothetical protein